MLAGVKIAIAIANGKAFLGDRTSNVHIYFVRKNLGALNKHDSFDRACFRALLKSYHVLRRK